jgi:soluble lytic murein transglycosylase
VSSVKARAQSAPTLEAVRVHRVDALKLAQGDLASCSSKACARLPQLSLLVGYLLLADGRAADALQQLSSIDAPADLKAFHAYYLAEAHFYAHDKPAAAAGFARAAEASEGWFQRRARARQGESLLAAGFPSDSLKLLETAASEANSPELYYERAIARAQTGDLQGARSDFKLIAVRFPVHPCAALVLNQGSALPGGMIRFTLDEHLARAHGFVEAGETTRALEELAQADREKLVVGTVAQSRVALVRAPILFALGREKEAEAQLKITSRGEPRIASEGMLIAARRALRSNQNEVARRAMVEIEQRYPKELAADEAGYFIGWIDLQAGRWPEAVRSFVAFEKRHPHSRRRDEALWFQSLALILQHTHSEARRNLQTLVRQFPNSPLCAQARYWAARSLEITGEYVDQVAEEYRQLIRLFPGSFYSLLADSRLRDLGLARPIAFPDQPKAPKGAFPPDLVLARALSEAGLVRDANLESGHRLEAIRQPEDAMRIGHALQQMGEYGRAYGLAARVLWTNAYGNKEGEAVGLLYPRAYQPTVEKLAREQAIDPYLIWAIMRRESAFRTEVTSAANARGLMQVVPPTAVQISKRLAVDAPHADELFSADVNLRFAAWYLSQLMARFGHPALAAAAYNAGPGPVSRWVSERGALPLDLFVERIPYKETRAYVKQVVADYFTYRQLYENAPSGPGFDFTLPAALDAGINF